MSEELSNQINDISSEQTNAEDTLKDADSSSYSVQTNEAYKEVDDNHRSMNPYQMFMSAKSQVGKEKKHDDNVNYESGIMENLIAAKNKVGDGILLQATDTIKAGLNAEGADMIKSGLNVVLETILHGIVQGFFPSVERVRRDADGAKRSYLDTFVSLLGAMMGKLRCNHFVACRLGKWLQGRIPSAQLVVMMVESVVPEPFLEWFGVIKISVIDRSDNCDANYECSLDEMIEKEE